MKIEIDIKNTENIGVLEGHQIQKIQEVVTALVSAGALTGVKGGQSIIHFDGDGNFQGVQLSYWPWRRRKI